MIERVAAALSFNLPNDVTLTGTQEKRIAHAIIATMREPTLEMVFAGVDAEAPDLGVNFMPSEAQDAAMRYRAMIDAALTATKAEQPPA